MPRRAIVPGILAILCLSVAPAFAEEPPAGTTKPTAPIAEDDLFQMLPAVGRQLKIDRRTGRVSICEERNGEWACRLVADDRLAYEEEISRLEDDNARLLAENARLNRELGEQQAMEDSGKNGDGPWITPEDEKRLDEFMTFSDKAIRRFFGMVENLKRDFDQPNPL